MANLTVPFLCARRGCHRTAPAAALGALCDHHEGTSEPVREHVPWWGHLITILVLVGAVVLMFALAGCSSALAQDAPPAAPAAEGPGVDWLAAGEHVLALLAVVVIPLLARWGGRWATVGKVAITAIEAYQAARPSSPIKQAVAAEAAKRGVGGEGGVVDKAVQKVTG